MTSTGYGDITAHTSREEFIVLIALITGLLMYGYCLSSITATLTNKLRAKYGYYLDNFWGIRKGLSALTKNLKFPPLLDRNSEIEITHSEYNLTKRYKSIY